ncbi:hypothetical protein BGW38_004419, partial [Lunasporangiospora selenospora]
PSQQLLDSTPLNPITNLPKGYSRTHPPLGSGKLKQTIPQDKNPHAKSQATTHSEQAGTQTRLDFKPLTFTRYEDKGDDQVQEQDKATIRFLENTLATLKINVEQLQQQFRQEEQAAADVLFQNQKDEETLAKAVQEAGEDIKGLKDQISDQTEEIAKHEALVQERKQEISEKDVEIAMLLQEYQECEERMQREMMRSEFADLTDEVKELHEYLRELDEEAARLRDTLAFHIDEERMAEVECLKIELVENSILIKDMENQLQEGALDIESMPLTVEEEFEQLMERYPLSEGSELEKEAIKVRDYFISMHHSQFDTMRREHSDRVGQLKANISAHDHNLGSLRRKTAAAERAASQSEKDYENAERRCAEVKEEAMMTRYEINQLQTRLACL